MPAEHVQPVGLLQIAVFLDELVLLAVLVTAGIRLGDGAVASTVLAILLPLAAAAIWGRWLAPRARRRLRHPLRLIAKLAQIAVASALLAASGLVWWAAAFLVVSAALFTAGELSER
ncbi:MAG TPA: DUF2568 domain-containing protein [Gaiellales bacterium]|jgi:hypothetical protein|nr:DUF2568 domain-containing protein [Gaiellales bacterium]